RDMIADIEPAMKTDDMKSMQKSVREVFAAPALLDYVQALIAYTRRSQDFVNGLSPRAGLGILNAARAWAFLDGRLEVIPEDVQAIWSCVAAHRLSPVDGYAALSNTHVVDRILADVAIP
ncbi:MAG: MoxR family ATPase, partial [Burkholderiales bacterium]